MGCDQLQRRSQRNQRWAERVPRAENQRDTCIGTGRSQCPCYYPSGNERYEEKEEAGGKKNERIWLKIRISEGSRSEILGKKSKINWEHVLSSLSFVDRSQTTILGELLLCRFSMTENPVQLSFLGTFSISCRVFTDMIETRLVESLQCLLSPRCCHIRSNFDGLKISLVLQGLSRRTIISSHVRSLVCICTAILLEMRATTIVTRWNWCRLSTQASQSIQIDNILPPFLG